MQNHFRSFVNFSTYNFHCLASCSVRRGTTEFVSNATNPYLSSFLSLFLWYLIVSAILSPVTPS